MSEFYIPKMKRATHTRWRMQCKQEWASQLPSEDTSVHLQFKRRHCSWVTANLQAQPTSDCAICVHYAKCTELGLKSNLYFITQTCAPVQLHLPRGNTFSQFAQRCQRSQPLQYWTRHYTVWLPVSSPTSFIHSLCSSNTGLLGAPLPRHTRSSPGPLPLLPPLTWQVFPQISTQLISSPPSVLTKCHFFSVGTSLITLLNTAILPPTLSCS